MPKFDIQAIKESARGRGAEILSAIAGISRESLDGRHRPCPACGGVDRFRFDPVKEFALCSKCFDHDNGDIIAAVQHYAGCDFKEALRRIGEFVGVLPADASPSAPVDILAVVARSKGVTPDALQTYGASTADGWVIVPVYGPDFNRCSEFRMKPGSGKPAKGLFAANKPAGMFLPHVDGEVRRPQPGETWLMFEGPKDAAAASMRGHLAAGMPRNELSAKFAKMFRGVHVVLVPDRDVAGDDGAQKTAARLYRMAESVRIAVLPDELKPSKGADYRDILKRLGGEDAASEAIATAEPWSPPAVEAVATGDELSIWRDDARTDIGNGKRLIRRHGETMRWIPAWASWSIFTGERWETDAGCEAEARAKEVSAELWKEIELAEPQLAVMEDEKKANAIRATFKGFARSAAGAMGVRNMLTMAKSEVGIAVDHSQFDADPWVLNVANGTLDLRTGEIRRHDRLDYQTKLCPVAYDIDAECPLWARFLREITCGDRDLEGYLRRFAGYCLTGDTREHVLAFAYGVGANGKSVFVHVLRSLLGEDYSIQAAPELLMTRHGEAHPTERADLCGKRFVTTTEIEAGRRLNESLVKDLTGGDRIRARRMREDFWEFIPTHKVLMVGNHKPRISGTDNGIWRRLKLIPFNRTFSPAEQDKDLPRKLLAELPGILNWAIGGCMEWQIAGLGEPVAVQQATAEYRDSQDTIAAFLAECCVNVPEARVKAGLLYNRFKAWAEAAGERPCGNRTFGEEMGKRFRKIASNGIWYEGIGVNGEF